MHISGTKYLPLLISLVQCERLLEVPHCGARRVKVRKLSRWEMMSVKNGLALELAVAITQVRTIDRCTISPSARLECRQTLTKVHDDGGIP